MSYLNSNNTKIRYAIRDKTKNLVPPFPIDPRELTTQTCKIVCKEVNGSVHRKYTDFYAVGVYGGIATAYSVGCNFRCIFCWVDWSRDWPELYGEFYSPENVFLNLRKVMKLKGLRQARISGAEPTLCPNHLCEVLDLVHQHLNAFDLFVIETNGVVLACDKSLAPRLAQFASRSSNDNTVGHVRLSIRGGLPESFENKTGIKKEFVDLPFIAAQRLWDAGVSFHVAVVVDPRFTSIEDKVNIYQRLNEIDPAIRKGVEEEYLSPYPHALVRLRAVGRTDVTGKEMRLKERAALREKPKL